MSIDFSSLKGDLLSQAEMLLPSWLPDGKFEGREYMCADLSGGKGRSLKINKLNGRWMDFATGDKGGDLISLYAAIRKIGQAEAARELGASETPYIAPAPVEKKREPDRVLEIPPEGEHSFCVHPKHGKPSRTWSYRNDEGRLIGYIARYDREDGKEIVPFTWVDGKWSMKQFPYPRPLYGLDLLAKNKAAHVIIVEGEKSADAARQIMPKCVCITWPGGSKAWHHVDWSPLAGRKVLLWPDADFPGVEAMEAIHEWLEGICEEVTRIDPSDKPKGWDAADALNESWDAQTFKNWAKSKIVKPEIKNVRTDAAAEPQRVSEAHGNGKPENPYRAVDAGGSRASTSPGGSRVEAEQAATGTHGKPISLAEARAKKQKPRTSMPAYWEQKPWRAMVMQNDNGSAKPNYANAVAALRNDESWKGVMAYDSFHKRISIRRENDHGLPMGGWTDRCTNVAVEWVQQIGINASYQTVEQAARAVALEQEFNPLQDYLNTLEWDGVPRIGRWLVEYCEADEDEFTNAAGRLWMIGAVSRALNPGGKFDNALLLEGEQGIKKSTAFATLGGDYFTDDMPDLHHKDSKEAMRGAWIVEFGELSAMRKSDVEATKAFITRRTDRYRRSYGKDMEDFPRTSVFGGTTNSDEYLEDVKNRRFWPVRVFRIDIERLREDRDQMWAEAVAAYKAGEKWWMESDLDEHAKAAQESRRVIDPWETLVRRYVDEYPLYDDVLREVRWTRRDKPITWATLEDVLENCLMIPAKDRGAHQKGRVQKILKAMGWERKQTPVKWCYRAPDYV